jgi:hypothetical protein
LSSFLWMASLSTPSRSMASGTRASLCAIGSMTQLRHAGTGFRSACSTFGSPGQGRFYYASLPKGHDVSR